MAKSILNVVMQGASGKIGRTLVFRQMRNGETVIANRPKPEKRPPSAAQQAQRDHFANSAYKARIFSEDPILHQQYLAKAEPGQSAYNMAFADCLNAPVVKAVYHDEYNGQIGDVITLRAIDDFKVASVRLRILSAANVLIEQGLASPNDNGKDWIYIATANNNSPLSGSKIEVIASDHPGNETVEVITID